MSLNFSSDELDFLIRAIVSNHGQLPKDYEQDIVSRGVSVECRTEIKSVIKDLMFALDLSIEDITND